MDSGNILSILASLNGGNSAPAGPSNVMQTLAQDPQQPYYNPAPAQAPPPQPLAPPQTFTPPSDAAPAATPKRRRSLLDIIGSAADVIAKVGGAQALYQPSLDAREDRSLALGDHARDVTAKDIKIATDKFALGDLQNSRVGQVARGLQAIKQAGGDINQAWPILAQRMQLDPATTQSIGQALATNPTALDGLIAATTDPRYDQSKYGGSVVYGKDANGNLVAYQPSLGNDAARNILPEGVQPVDPVNKIVDTGGAQAIVGTDGSVKRILPKIARPDTVLTTTTSHDNNVRDNKTKIEIAGMPARSKDPAGTPKTGDANVPTLLNNIEEGFNSLHSMSALPGEGRGLGQIEGIIGRTALGQKAGEQLGMPAAQKRLEIMKNVSLLQQAMLKSLPASATRTKFEQEMLARGLPDPSKMSLSTARTVIQQLRKSYAEAVASSNKSTVPATVLPKRGSGGWSVVGVK